MKVGDVVNIRIIGNEYLVFAVTYRQETTYPFIQYEFICCNCRNGVVVRMEDEPYFTESLSYGYFIDKNYLRGRFSEFVAIHPASCLVTNPTVSSPLTILSTVIGRPETIMTNCLLPPGEMWESAWRHCEYYESASVQRAVTCKFSSLPTGFCSRDIDTAKERVKIKRASRKRSKACALVIKDDIRMIRDD